MAVTVDIQSNPLPSNVGKKSADATIIYSGISDGNVQYEITKRDGSSSFVISTNAPNLSDYPQIVSISSDKLEIILDFRTEYRARSKRRSSSSWSSWVSFKTRDKRYQTPDAMTQLSDNTNASSAEKNHRYITVTNGAKATVRNTSRGATVTNTDNGYVATTSITYNRYGATVRNS